MYTHADERLLAPRAAAGRVSTLPAPPPEARRAAIEHPALRRTLRDALELVSRELPVFDPGLRRLLIAGYRADEGVAAQTPGSRAKALVLEHEAAFRSALPKMVAVCLNAEFQRLGARLQPSPPSDADGSQRARTIAALVRRIPTEGPGGVAELDRRLAGRLGLDALDSADNPLRPGVFLHAVGVCWRAVAGSDRHELEVIAGFGAQWLPVLHRQLLPALLAGLPASPDEAPPPARDVRPGTSPGAVSPPA
jgi:hypothetical protein